MQTTSYNLAYHIEAIANTIRIFKIIILLLISFRQLLNIAYLLLHVMIYSPDLIHCTSERSGEFLLIFSNWLYYPGSILPSIVRC